MSILDHIKGGVREVAIARPVAARSEWIYKHAEQKIPWKAQLTVGQAELAMFYRNGRFIGVLPEGRHTLDSNVTPFLGQLLDKASGLDVLIVDLYFVSTVENLTVKFATRFRPFIDPETSFSMGLAVQGEIVARVFDLTKLVVGSGVQSHAALQAWFKRLIEKEIEDPMVELITTRRWPMRDVSAGSYTHEISENMSAALRKPLERYGLGDVRFGDLTTRLDPADAARINTLMDKQSAKAMHSPPSAESKAQATAMLAQLGHLRAAGILDQAEYDAKVQELRARQ